jgi:L-lactate permease
MITILIALFLIEFVVLALLVNYEQGFLGLTSLVVAGFTYKVITGITFTSMGQYVLSHWGSLVGYAIAYLFIGVLWSFFKWFIYVKKGKANGKSKATFEALSNKNRIIRWMSYWPVSSILYIVSDPIRDLYNWIYSKVSGVYTNILNKAYGE